MEECIIMDKERKEDIPGGGAFVILTLYFFKDLAFFFRASDDFLVSTWRQARAFMTG